jgi:8-amino-7-oxononanoate synthase
MSKNQLSLLAKEGLTGVRVTDYKDRELVSGGKKLLDFSSTNYLSFDFQPHVIERGMEYARRWGSLMPWSRLEADYTIYEETESKIAAMLKAPKVLLSHTITLANFSLMPLIAKKGIILADKKVHAVVWEACRLARDHGAKLVQFEHQNLRHLESLMEENKHHSPMVIAVDGIYSVSTEKAPIRELQALAHKYGAWLYLDDAHGFGIVGENPTASNPYGVGGGGLILRETADYSRTFYVSSFGKAFCVYTAFVTIPKEFEDDIPTAFLSNLYSAPVSPFTLGCVEGAMELNREIGEKERGNLRARVKQLIDGMGRLGLKFTNELLHPVVFLEVGEVEPMMEVTRYLLEKGVLAGIRAYPVVPKDQCGLRFAVNSNHTEEQIQRTIEILESCPTLRVKKAA